MSNPIKSIGKEAERAGKRLKSAFAFDFKPDVPKMPDIPSAAPQADLSGVLAAERQRRLASRRSGRASTILTSPTGVSSSGSVATKTLLGQ